MSIMYGIYITLHTSYNKANVKKIIEKGFSLGFIYYNHIWKNQTVYSRTLSIEEAIQKAMDQSPDILKEGGPYIDTKLEDTRFLLRVSFDHENLAVSIGAINDPWKKVFWNTPQHTIYIDFSRYIRLLLKLCNEFVILSLKTHAD